MKNKLTKLEFKWICYDMGNSAFILLVATILPIYFNYLSSGSLTLAHSQNSQMSFMYGFFFAKFLFFTVVCVVIVI